MALFMLLLVDVERGGYPPALPAPELPFGPPLVQLDLLLQVLLELARLLRVLCVEDLQMRDHSRSQVHVDMLHCGEGSTRGFEQVGLKEVDIHVKDTHRLVRLVLKGGS